jgi:hypothetical protein
MEGEGEGGGRAKLIRSREEYGWRESKREGEDQRESDRRERKGGRRREIVASLVLSSSLSLTLPHHNTHPPTHTHTHTHIGLHHVVSSSHRWRHYQVFQLGVRCTAHNNVRDAPLIRYLCHGIRGD